MLFQCLGDEVRKPDRPTFDGQQRADSSFCVPQGPPPRFNHRIVFHETDPTAIRAGQVEQDSSGLETRESNFDQAGETTSMPESAAAEQSRTP